MDHTAWNPIWIRGSRIEEMIWIGHDVLAWSAGLHIIFLNIAQTKQSMRWCWNHELGEGARCLSSHSRLKVFAFTEKVVHPRILTFAYPSMTKISECQGGCPSGYLATAFTAGDHMVSVGFYPDFPMSVWNWRTGEKIITVNTSIRDEVGQILRITRSAPNVIAQMGKTCGRLITWDMDVAGKRAILKDHEIKLASGEDILWVDWCPTSTEPLLAITDRNGHIFLSNYDGSDLHRIILSQRCSVCLEIELPMVCWFREGIVLRTTFCQVRYYKKNARTSRWAKVWYLKSLTRPCLLVADPFKSNRLFYHTFEGYLMQIDCSKDEKNPTITKFFDYGAAYKFADFVYPWCHHLVVIDDLKEITVLECYSGRPVATVDPEIEGEICSQTSHPDYPLIVLGTLQGEAVFVSLVNPEEPNIAACLRLQRNPLDLIKFSHSGRSVVVAEKKTGNCYCISVYRDKAFKVLALLNIEKTITDLLVYEAFRSLKVLALYSGAKQFGVGQRLHVYDIPDTRNLVTHITSVLDLPGVYRTLDHAPGNAMLLIGSPYLTKQIRVQKVLDFKDTTLIDNLASGHNVRLANVFVDRSWITTTALDGLLLVRDKNIRKVSTCVMTHHRSDFGTVKAMASRQGDLIVSLGYNGSLVAIHSAENETMENSVSTLEKPLSHYEVDSSLSERYRKKILTDYSTLDLVTHEVLTKPRIQIPAPEEGDKTWSEWRDEMQILEEKEASEAEKAAILEDFEVLKVKVKELLDANEMCPDIEKLPIASFDLDIIGRDQRLKAGRDECEDTSMELEHKIKEMSRVSAWIRETFWEPQEVVGKTVCAIFDDVQVTNYPSVAEVPGTEEHLEWAQFCKEAMQKIMKEDTFDPWRLYTDEELQVELNKRVKLFKEEEIRIDLTFDDEEEEKGVTEEDIERQRAIEGSSTYRYIEPSPYYPQIEFYAFGHVLLNNRFLLHDCERLRAYFNKEFDELYTSKQREMDTINERIERIRYIDSELNTMFGERVPRVPADPQWHWQERPETIIGVQDDEIKAKPYVSPSEQEILDRQAAEAERIRQLMLVDDFRERALMAMMDGVLEVRWEDTIKIDVPKPACMREKKPENYTAEDIQTVKQYEKDVAFLTEERQRYKRILEAEYYRVMSLLQDGIDSFNTRVDELFYLKISIESAIHQLQLRYVRGCLRNYRRIKSFQAEDEIKKQIAKKRETEDVLRAHLQTFQNIHHDIALQYEVLATRERTVTKKFKSEFPTLGKLNVELLERQSKRRPRANLKNLTSSDFLQLASHVATRTQSTYLPTECKDFLKALDHLDSRPNILPVSIETPHWEHLIKIRRQRIALELNVKAKQAEITDVEMVVLGFEQKIEKCKKDVAAAKKALVDLRLERTISELNIEIQLVLKMGQVEVNLNGDLSDTENAILIPRSEIEKVNRLIEAAGKCKLDALSQLLTFQTGTLLKEWEHECKRKHLEDLQEDLRFTESVTVTKEMQQYLKRQAKGLKDDKSPMQMSDDINAIKRRFETVLEKHRARLETIEKEIATTRSKNEQLDRKIFEMNVERCGMEQRRDLTAETLQQKFMERKIKLVMRRAHLIRKLQDNYSQLIELQTEHELLRLRRYPTLYFKTLDESRK